MQKFSQTFIAAKIIVTDKEHGKAMMETSMTFNDGAFQHTTIYLTNEQRKELIEALQELEPV